MSRFFACFAAFAMSIGLSVAAVSAEAPTPVVVELYTSQGCSSCPPADAMLRDLAARDDVIALGFHVDYWDYIGWKDAFAVPEHALRQRDYARAGNRRSVFTPEMIVNGADSIVGGHASAVEASIEEHKAKDSGIRIALKRTGKGLQIDASASRQVPALEIHLLHYTPSKDVKITRGENRGRHLGYANVVHGWDRVGVWRNSDTYSATVGLREEAPVVVLVQEPAGGSILAAARIK